MNRFRQPAASFPWLAGLRWSFVGYVAGTLLAAGANSAGFPMLAGGILLLAAACFVGSIVCAAMSAWKSRVALLYLALAGVMIVLALLFGNGNSIN